MTGRTNTIVVALDDTLQADVMRFMAIIAFCLIAIMALARNAAPLEAVTEAAAVEAALPETLAPAALRTGAVRVEPPVPEAPLVQTRPAEVAMAPQDQVEDAQSEPAPLVEQRRERVVAHPQAVAPPRSAEAVAAEAPPPIADPAPEAARTDASDAGLSLRFASDADFLRLVSRKAIEVYAFREGEVLVLLPSLRFTATRPPGPVHELLPGTIPAPVDAALAGARDDTTAFSWGVRIPGRIERRVRAHVDAGDAGVLVIDRFGEVRLLARAGAREMSG